MNRRGENFQVQGRRRKMQSTKTILVFAVVHVVGCLGNDNSTEREDAGDFFLMNLIWECTKSGNVGICLKSKAADYLDKLVRTKQPLRINEYLSLGREPSIPGTEDPDLNNSEAKGEKTSEEMAEERSGKLDGIIWSKLSSLFRTRNVQLTVPPDGFEGRGKEGKIFKKGYGFFLMAAMMGGMLMKLALAKIALIAGKALVIGKIALILSLIISLKKFVGSGGGGGQAEVIYASPEHGGRSWPKSLRLDLL